MLLICRRAAESENPAPVGEVALDTILMACMRSAWNTADHHRARDQLWVTEREQQVSRRAARYVHAISVQIVVANCGARRFLYQTLQWRTSDPRSKPKVKPSLLK